MDLSFETMLSHRVGSQLIMNRMMIHNENAMKMNPSPPFSSSNSNTLLVVPMKSNNNSLQLPTITIADRFATRESYILPEYYILGDKTVVCGRGSVCFNHTGNKKFRQLIEIRLDKYSTVLTKFEKTALICEVIHIVRMNDPTGIGFVKKELNNGRYYKVGDYQAKEKTSQAFRDALNDRYKNRRKNLLIHGIGNTNTNPHHHLQYAMSAPTMLNLQNMLLLHSSNNHNTNLGSIMNNCGGINNATFVTNKSSAFTNPDVIPPSYKSSVLLEVQQDHNNFDEQQGQGRNDDVNDATANRFLRNNGNHSMLLQECHDSAGLDDILNNVDWNRLIEEEMVGGGVNNNGNNNVMSSKRQSCPNLTTNHCNNNMTTSSMNVVTSLLMSNNTNENINDTILYMDTHTTNNDHWKSFFDNKTSHKTSVNLVETDSTELSTANTNIYTKSDNDQNSSTTTAPLSSNMMACGKQNPLLALWQKHTIESRCNNDINEKMVIDSNEMNHNIHQSNNDIVNVDRQQINNTVIVDNTITDDEGNNNTKLFDDLMNITDLLVVNHHHDPLCSTSSVFSESNDLFEPTSWEMLNETTSSCEAENHIISG